MSFNQKGCSSDEGSAYVRLFKQIKIQDEEKSENENEIENEYDKNTLNNSDSNDLAEHSQWFLQIADDEAVDDFDSNGHSNLVRIYERGGTSDDVELDLDESNEYCFPNRGEPVKNLEIELGTCKIGRYSYACHKCNIAVRLTINSNNPLHKVIQQLSKFRAKHKNTISSVKICISKKVRFRINNETRWASVFLLLDCFHQEYLRSVFNLTFKCPVSLEVKENYMQILLPVFQFNLILQNNSSTIADVMPIFNILISKWTIFEVYRPYKALCNSLIT
ncbi:hypothetical protein BpHYR1_035864 [Brachionus plicatilis]|uniref:Uncharacterized protein n=1 Tax=Brachionus plicatilis TaxID=10195 RepID=A0A3M7PVL7_BRAPC|nr:hypothetical protein BpHYR1_035864 [Brachionus plicatilis]